MSLQEHSQDKSKRSLTDMQEIVTGTDFRKKFICPEESIRYSGSLEQMVFNRLRNNAAHVTVIEFGSGTGSPVISAVLNSAFLGTVHGYEINSEAAETAIHLINENGLNSQYFIHNESFFEAQNIPVSDWLIVNPPYLPCENREWLTLPDLCGGSEGNDISKRLLSYGYKNVLLLMSSYSNPAALVDHALSLGYKIPDFQITKMSFGIYSSQDVVQERIHEMKKDGKAFFTKNCYLVGSAFFTKAKDCEKDLSSEFLSCLTSIGRI